MRRTLRIAAPALLALACVAASLAGQTRHEIVRGRVLSDSDAAVPDADVIVTRTSDAVAKATQSDAQGRYSVDWPDGTGDYAFTVSAPGFRTYSSHLVRGADSVIVADVRLVHLVQQLAAVLSQATRPVPDRDPASFAIGGSGSSTIAQNSGRRLAPDQAGDLTAIAAMLPGVALTSTGISVLGLPSSQNAVTLGGLAFAGADIPRDATTRVRVQTSSYDPANGWFSGAQTAVDLVIGDQFTNRTSHFTADAPPLEFNDPISARLGQRFTNLNASIGGNGQLVDDRWAYNYGLQGGRKVSTAASILSADPDLLAHAGVSSDSVSRFLGLLGQAGVPITAASFATSTIDDNVSFIGRVDHAPYDWIKLAYNPVSYGVQGYAKYDRTQGVGLTPIGTPAHAGETNQQIGAVTGFFSALFGPSYLADLRSGLTLTRNTSAPDLAVPDGRTLVASNLAGATPSVSTLAFGGNSAMNSRLTTFRWETQGELQLYPPGLATHRLKIAGDARFDSYDQSVLTNEFGSYSYNSLADLAAGQPASFTRTLTSPARTGGEWNAFASVGDLWRVSTSWQVIYGARLDGNVFTKAPLLNPSLASALGVRTNEAPATLGVSPRLGFNWQNGKGKIVRGGIGQFRNVVDATLLAAPSVSTGLPGGTTRLSCIGGAVPAPNWSAFATNPSSIPAQCAGVNGILIDSAPAVQHVDPSYQPARSWRANLGYQSSAWRNVFTVEALGSLNVDQPGSFDRNLSAAPAFFTSDERRPVFAAPSAIVPATGLVSPTVARRVGAFGRVVDVVSDLRSQSAQGILTLRPYVPTAARPYFGDVILAYTLTDVRSQQRGFDGAAFGDPTLREWARGDLDARHQLVAQMVFRPLGDGRVLTYVYGRAMSGLPYTPLVNADVNGDGLVNDRAFVFDPAATSDPTLAAGMRSLLANATPNVRDCLDAQLGRASARNSCQGPWTASLNLGVRLSGQSLLHMPRADVTLNLTNPLGGLDQLLHGTNNLRGWGTPATPDQTLYTVRGFDPSTSRFLYMVNPR
ncbi:MAG: carboxypeptidase-like regulatory domain-containing protein, partial [Gemmatimonadales bacterium]